jgi:hypothetical protein
MMRFPVRVAFGLTALLIAPSFAMAQVARDVKNPRDPLLRRGFSRITFGATAPTQRPAWESPRMMDPFLLKEGVRLPSVTVAPEPHGTRPPCVMRVVPVDPSVKSRMPVVSVDERIDPKSVLKVPECQPRD